MFSIGICFQIQKKCKLNSVNDARYTTALLTATNGITQMANLSSSSTSTRLDTCRHQLKARGRAFIMSELMWDTAKETHEPFRRVYSLSGDVITMNRQPFLMIVTIIICYGSAQEKATVKRPTYVAAVVVKLICNFFLSSFDGSFNEF